MSAEANVLTAARAYIATLVPSRGFGHFKEHITDIPFQNSPLSGFEGFCVNSETMQLTRSFGVDASEEGEFQMVVDIGHSDSAIEKTRENFRARDVKRLADLLEAYTWPTIVSPENVRGVWFTGATTDKANASWWITTLRFRVIAIGAIELS